MGKRKKKYHIDESYPLIMENHSFEFEWCCDCGLRHVNFFEIERAKKPEDDKVKIFCTRDSHATDYRKDYERLKKKKKEINAMPHKTKGKYKSKPGHRKPKKGKRK